MGIDVRATNEKIEILGSSHFFNNIKEQLFSCSFLYSKVIIVLKIGN